MEFIWSALKYNLSLALRLRSAFNYHYCQAPRFLYNTVSVRPNSWLTSSQTSITRAKVFIAKSKVKSETKFYTMVSCGKWRRKILFGDWLFDFSVGSFQVHFMYSIFYFWKDYTSFTWSFFLSFSLSSSHSLYFYSMSFCRVLLCEWLQIFVVCMRSD